MTMTLTKEQIQEMLDAARPLILWLRENFHHHCEAKVDGDSVELTEGVAREKLPW